MKIPKYIPVAVSQLKLGQAFKNYQTSVFECYETTNETDVMVVDDNRVHITLDPEDEYRCCHLINDEAKELVVLSIDHGLISQVEGGMADGAAFTDEKFAFIEFKDKAEGRNDEAVQSTYEKAASQLKQAYVLFSSKMEACGIDFLDTVEVVCHVVVSDQFPRANATEQSEMVKFATAPETLGVELNFERRIKF